ncbi:MAG: sigma factor-like helix-turn-helix DNA-binding protein [Patescibacteria group bacterium]
MIDKVKKIDIIKITNDLISSLSDKQSDVLVKRFGLKDGKRRTLEEIGRGYNITRERVRQIENDAKAAFLKLKDIKKLDAFFNALEYHIENFGGLRIENHLLSTDLARFFPKDIEEKEAESFMYFLLNSSSRFIKTPESQDFYGIWSLKKSIVQIAKSSLELLVKKLASFENTITRKELLKWLSDIVSQDLSDGALESYLSASKNISSNVYGDYGLKYWSEISTKGVRDKAYLVLKKYGKPMHFRFVVDEINDKFKNKRKAHPQTVHNELIKDDKFILVGRGTYALSDWGFKSGTVSDVLKRVLQDNNGPMKKEDILGAVLKERDVKENTVMLNLQNRDFFEKINDGRYIYKA